MATVYVAPVRSRKEKVWHATPDCSHAPENPTDRTLECALSDGLTACRLCVLEVRQPATQDRGHYRTLIESGETGSA